MILIFDGHRPLHPIYIGLAERSREKRLIWNDNFLFFWSMENFHQSVVHSEQQLTYNLFFFWYSERGPEFQQSAKSDGSCEAVLKIAAEGTCDEEMKGAMGIGLSKIEKMGKECSTT